VSTVIQRAKTDRAFLGHPVGLGWLAGSEFWERFSYYGMQALLVLYMTHQLLTPGHTENVIGFAAFQRLLETINHRALSGEALASATTVSTRDSSTSRPCWADCWPTGSPAERLP
jgi:hypothetical protein